MPPFHEEQIFRQQIDEQHKRYAKQSNAAASSRTQHKLQLQRLSFLTNDKNYLDHPKNMKRLTKEIDRVNREYRCVRRFEDPIQESFRRLNERKASVNSTQDAHLTTTATIASKAILSRTDSQSSSSSSSNSSSLSSSAEQQNGFLGRWFAQENTTSSSINSHLNNSHIIDSNAVVYSFHPTIANSMKRRTKH
ncbi:uncharacterized protein EV154DRAFT_560212 [Mucor mucedo]|uniref:uncharacterized protein n=1 Tax=Mucor mucedo TaxID=29922 RepID=UPI00221E8348|nr:uncharacterized protein EV154DRAFT_560212 [Mucor mucedo]KAI7894562.1 hypothetical protein EV154DRAFT_560212 [Mucor mucedo]